MNRRGNGSISIIIVVMLIMVLIVLPFSSMVFENYYVSIVSREIVDASFASMSSTFDSINIATSTNDSLDYRAGIREKFEEFLKYNLVLDENLQSQNDKFSRLEILEFKNMYSGSIDSISGQTMNRQTIHIEMRVEFEAMFLMSDIDQKRYVDIHFDYEIPIDK